MRPNTLYRRLSVSASANRPQPSFPVAYRLDEFLLSSSFRLPLVLKTTKRLDEVLLTPLFMKYIRRLIQRKQTICNTPSTGPFADRPDLFASQDGVMIVQRRFNSLADSRAEENTGSFP